MGAPPPWYSQTLAAPAAPTPQDTPAWYGQPPAWYEQLPEWATDLSRRVGDLEIRQDTRNVRADEHDQMMRDIYRQQFGRHFSSEFHPFPPPPPPQ